DLQSPRGRPFHDSAVTTAKLQKRLSGTQVQQVQGRRGLALHRGQERRAKQHHESKGGHYRQYDKQEQLTHHQSSAAFTAFTLFSAFCRYSSSCLTISMPRSYLAIALSTSSSSVCRSASIASSSSFNS